MGLTEPVVLVCTSGSEFSRLTRERELQEIDVVALADEPLTGIQLDQINRIDRLEVEVLRREHRNMVQTYVRQVKLLARLICLLHRPFSESSAASRPNVLKVSEPAHHSLVPVLRHAQHHDQACLSATPA
jgi:hypothetical protein